MSCCGGEDGHSARSLIHDLSSPWIDQDKPVTVDFMGKDGVAVVFVVTGVTSTARGQSLELEQIEPSS